jgi:hypothetical protein
MGRNAAADPARGQAARSGRTGAALGGTASTKTLHPHLLPPGTLLGGQPTTLGVPHVSGMAQAASPVSRARNFRR